MTAAAVLPWVLSCTTITVMWLAGNKRREAWWLGFASQTLWAWFAIEVKAWGMFPMIAALVIVYARNAWKWRATPETGVEK